VCATCVCVYLCVLVCVCFGVCARHLDYNVFLLHELGAHTIRVNVCVCVCVCVCVVIISVNIAAVQTEVA